MKKRFTKERFIALVTSIFFSLMILPSPRITQAQESLKGNLSNLGSYRTYNGVAFENYYADKADMEGKLAVKGDIHAPRTANSFDIGAAGLHSGVTVGEDILDFSTPVFLLGGNVVNNEGTRLQVCSGYAVTTSEENAQKLYDGGKFKGTEIYEKSQVDANFSQILNDINNVSKFAASFTAGEIITDDENFKFAKANENPKILVNTLGRGTEVSFNNNQEFKIPNLDSYEAIIFYSEATTINFNKVFWYEGSSYPLASQLPDMKKVAHKMIWILPNATSITESNIDVPGTIIAPNAKVSVNSSSINGQVFAREIVQTGGGELHNFIFDWDSLNKDEKPDPPIEPEGPEPEVKKGSLELLKVDSQDDKALEEAIFELKYPNGEVKEYTTNSEGKIQIQDLEQGKYSLKEKVAPKGYELGKLEGANSEGWYELEIKEDNLKVELKVKNTKEEKPEPPKPPVEPEEPKPEVKKGSLELLKVDSQDDKALEEAIFELKYPNNEVKEYTTNSEGKIQIQDLEQGKYSLKEKTAPKGYELGKLEGANSEGWYELEIKEDNLKVELKVKNTKEEKPEPPKPPVEPEEPKPEVKKGLLELLKVDSQDDKALEGAIFQLKYPNGEVKEYTTNSEGKIQIQDLEQGKYSLKEKVAPKGYELGKLEGANSEGWYELEIKEDNLKVELKVKNTKEEKPEPPKPPVEPEEPKPEVKKGSLELLKVDSQDDKALEGAIFELKYPNNEVKEYTTNSEGKIQIQDLEQGKYSLKEKVAPKGYELGKLEGANSEGWYELEIKEDNLKVELKVKNTKEEKPEPPKPPVEPEEPKPEVKKGLLELLKVDSQDDKALEGAIFELKYPNNEVKEYTTNSEGKIQIQDLEQGKYSLKEKVAPKGYELGKLEGANSEGWYELEIKEDNLKIELKVKNTKEEKPEPPKPPVEPEEPKPEVKKGLLELLKVDSQDDKALEGAIFELKYPNGEVKEYTTNSEGKIQIQDLEQGKYSLKEKTAPKGYELGKLEGANSEGWYELEIKEDNLKIELKVKNTKEEKPEPPKPPVEPEEPKPEVKKGLLELLKVDSQDDKALEGAIFELKYPNGEVKEYTTNSEGKIQIQDLEQGKYSLKEKVAPKGYELGKLEGANSEGWYELEIKEDNLKVELKVKNTKEEKPEPPKPPVEPEEPKPEVKKGLLELLKVDSQDDKALEGAIFQLKYPNGEVKEYTTNSEGKIQIQDLEQGKYSLKEKVAPKGYELGKLEGANSEGWYELEIKEDNLKVELKVKNTKEEKPEPPIEPEIKKGSLEITKIDADTKKVLEGVEFEVFDLNGKSIKKLTTDKNGFAKFENLEQGKYILKEIKAANGYTLDKGNSIWSFEITKDKNIIKTTIKNKKNVTKPSIKPDTTKPGPVQGLPDTGDTSAIIYVVIAAIAVIAIVVINRRKKIK